MSYVQREAVPGRGYIDAISGVRFDTEKEAEASVNATLYLLVGPDPGEYSLNVLKEHYYEWQRIAEHVEKRDDGLYANKLTGQVGHAFQIRPSVIAALSEKPAPAVQMPRERRIAKYGEAAVAEEDARTAARDARRAAKNE